MFNHLGHVRRVGFPEQVSFGAAGFVTIAARMSGFMIGCWRRTILLGAQEPMNQLQTAILKDQRVAVGVSRVGPRSAFIAFVGEKHITKIAQWLAVLGPAAEWIAVTVPALIMSDTPAMSKHWLATVWNRANMRMSHAGYY